MKIKIGPFIDRWTTTSFENWWLEFNHKKPYFDVSNSEEDALDKFVEKWCDRWQTVLNLTINQYLDRKQRKVKIQIDKYDTWGMDHTLGLIILTMLIQLKATKHGSPDVDAKDVPAKLRVKNAPKFDEYGCEGDEYTDGNWHKRWDWVMDEMIWTFTQLTDDDNDSQFHKGKIDFLHIPIDKDGNECSEEDADRYRMVKGPNDTHTFNKKDYTKHNERIQRGTTLFGKYFRGLWD